MPSLQAINVPNYKSAPPPCFFFIYQNKIYPPYLSIPSSKSIRGETSIKYVCTSRIYFKKPCGTSRLEPIFSTYQNLFSLPPEFKSRWRDRTEVNLVARKTSLLLGLEPSLPLSIRLRANLQRLQEDGLDHIFWHSHFTFRNLNTTKF